MPFEDDKRFEEELRRACRVVDPGDAFTRRVLTRLTVETARPRPATRLSWRVVLPFAAALAISAGGAAWLQHARYVEEGQRARAQVLTALRLTSEKLNVVRSAVIDAQEPR